jgi:uncharacterized protein DUF4386
MTARQRTGRMVGALYFGMGSFAALDIQYFPGRFIVAGDAAATAARIASSPLLYRLWTVTELVAGVFAIYLAVALYRFFKDVDRGQAQALAAFVLVQIPMWFTLAILHLAPLGLLNGSSTWSVFTTAQLEALAQGSLILFGRGVNAMSAYWGFWLLPFALLVYRSGFVPRLIGVFLFIAGVAYVLSAATYFVFPAWHQTVFWVAAPLYGLGEIAIVGWLLIKGAREDIVTA